MKEKLVTEPNVVCRTGADFIHQPRSPTLTGEERTPPATTICKTLSPKAVGLHDGRGRGGAADGGLGRRRMG
ncbi:hypothetical protein RHMOL_Rhmol01G0137200 [Rhododendron molle]|uniref:Uncharacterized protein n=1 Tax=Rhododendron molle TaxID=49168 RepID=A0ACC0Q134_RHOML|nr:hypothetical protein RHMOL_Rhmol01G0137200 [Rhododendron molle]